MLDEPNKPDITDKEILCLEVAGLCHDLGLYSKVSQLKRRVRQFFDGVFILIFQDMVHSLICLINYSSPNLGSLVIRLGR